MTTAPARPATPPADGPDTGAPPPPHRARRRILAGLAAFAILAVALGLWFTLGGERAHQTSEDEARARVGTTVAAPTTSAGAAPLTSAPAAGVYRYTGAGRENTSFPPLTEEQGPSMPATVTLQPDGCWELRIDYNTHHWQSWTSCTAGGEVHERNGATYSKRNFGGLDVENTSSFTCDPPAVVLTATDEAGDSRTRSCTGSGSLITAPTTASGTTTVVGREPVDVAGTPMPAVHVRSDLTYTGAQSGTETTELWLDATTGLPLRNEHHIVVETDTPLGKVTYTEDAHFALQEPGPV